MATKRNPFCSKRLMISPTRPRCTPSGLMAMKVRSLLAMVLRGEKHGQAGRRFLGRPRGRLRGLGRSPSLKIPGRAPGFSAAAARPRGFQALPPHPGPARRPAGTGLGDAEGSADGDPPHAVPARSGPKVVGESVPHPHPDTPGLPRSWRGRAAAALRKLRLKATTGPGSRPRRRGAGRDAEWTHPGRPAQHQARGLPASRSKPAGGAGEGARIPWRGTTGFPD